MALIKCVECGKEISDKAYACPNCGCPAEYQSLESTLDSKNPAIQITTESQKQCSYGKEWDEIMHELLVNHSSLGAISMIRKITGISLSEAKKITDYIKIHHEPPKEYAYLQPPMSEVILPAITRCKTCYKEISNQAETCPHCGQPTGVHVCPKCGSINTQTISDSSKAFSIFMWGAYSANKVMSKYQCKDCWHKF